MRIVSAAEIDTALEYPALIERLRQAFRAGDTHAPQRQHYAIPTYGEQDGTLLVMPAWQQGRHIGIKLVTLFPDNAQRSLPSIMGAYLLLDGKSGSPLALLDGPKLTVRRTAAASALAAGYLARVDASRLLVVGTGALAPHLALAHAAARPLREILFWGRSFEKADALAKRLKITGVSIAATDDLPSAAAGAHIISCATLASTPVVLGEWLSPGTHLDLVGGFTPEMRETDDNAIERARIFVDTRAGALAEAGDIIAPIKSGVMAEDDIAGDLFDLTQGGRAGRRYHDQITLFKSVGTAVEDLAAAQFAYQVV